MLLKPTRPTFVPGIPGREYRPYSRECPSPPPPSPTPSPDATCTLVPVYGASAPESGEGGTGAPTIVGFQNVCSDGTSTAWGASGGGGSSRPPATPVSGVVLLSEYPRTSTKAETVFFAARVRRDWFELRAKMSDAHVASSSVSGYAGAWAVAFRFNRGTMPQTFDRYMFPTLTHAAGSDQVGGGNIFEYAFDDASYFNHISVLKRDEVWHIRRPDSGEFFVTGVATPVDPSRQIDISGTDKADDAKYSPPVIASRVFPQPLVLPAVPVDKLQWPASRAGTLNLTTGPSPGVPKFYVLEFPYKYFVGHARLELNGGIDMATAPQRYHGTSNQIAQQADFQAAYGASFSQMSYAPLMGAYPANQLPWFISDGIVDPPPEISSPGVRPSSRPWGPIYIPQGAATGSFGNGQSLSLFSAEPFTLNGTTAYFVIGVCAYGLEKAFSCTLFTYPK